MIDIQKQIELLELQGNDAELLSLLTVLPAEQELNRIAADRFRMLAVELRGALITFQTQSGAKTRSQR